jgi:hypothetical protein
MSNAGFRDRPGKSGKAMYYPAQSHHYDGDLVHSEFTDLVVSVYTMPGKILPKHIPYDQK